MYCFPVGRDFTSDFKSLPWRHRRLPRRLLGFLWSLRFFNFLFGHQIRRDRGSERLDYRFRAVLSYLPPLLFRINHYDRREDSVQRRENKNISFWTWLLFSPLGYVYNVNCYNVLIYKCIVLPIPNLFYLHLYESWCIRMY